MDGARATPTVRGRVRVNTFMPATAPRHAPGPVTAVALASVRPSRPTCRAGIGIAREVGRRGAGSTAPADVNLGS